MNRYKAKLSIEVTFDAENRAQAEAKMKKAARATRILQADRTRVDNAATVERIEPLLF